MKETVRFTIRRVLITYRIFFHLLLVVSLTANYLAISHQYGVFKISTLERRERALDAEYQKNGTAYAMAIAEAGKEAKATTDNHKKHKRS